MGPDCGILAPIGCSAMMALPSNYLLCIRWPDTLAQFVFPWIERVFYPINGLWKVPNHT